MKLSLSDPEKASARISTCCRSGAQCLQAETQNFNSWIKFASQRNSARREREEKAPIHQSPPPGVIDTIMLKKSQVKGGSRTAPSGRRRPQIEAVINHASAEWNRTTAIAPYRVLRWSSTTVLLSMSPGVHACRPPALAPGWRSVLDETTSQ